MFNNQSIGSTVKFFRDFERVSVSHPDILSRYKTVVLFEKLGVKLWIRVILIAEPGDWDTAVIHQLTDFFAAPKSGLAFFSASTFLSSPTFPMTYSHS